MIRISISIHLILIIVLIKVNIILKIPKHTEVKSVIIIKIADKKKERKR